MKRSDIHQVFRNSLLSSLFFLLGCDAFKVKFNPAEVDEVIPQNSWILQLGAVTKAFPEADNSERDGCNGIASDSAGNVYCGGETYGSVGEPNGGNGDAFVMKINSSGRILWVRQLGGQTQASSPHVLDATNGDRCMSVASDSVGNVYCGGVTYGSLAEANGGSGDAFVMKLNSNGEILWIRQLGSATQASSSEVNNTSAFDTVESISVDASGNVYAGGSTSGSLGETNGGGHDGFVFKLNSDGEVQWVRQFGSVTEGASPQILSTSGNQYCNSVAVDTSGNVYCGGTTTGAFAETSGGGTDIMLMKLNSSGVIQWVSQIGSATQATSPYVLDASSMESCHGIALDTQGNIYCGGTAWGSFAEPTGGSGDVLVVKFNTNGVVTWARQVGSDSVANSEIITSTSAVESCRAITVDTVGNIYCAGEAGSQFAEAPGDWQWDPMAIKFDSNGVIKWAKQLGSVTFPGPSYHGGGAYGIALGPNGTVYFSGEIYGASSEPADDDSVGDVFVAKLKADGTL